MQLTFQRSFSVEILMIEHDIAVCVLTWDLLVYCCGGGRYICSSAKDAPKPALSLLEEYWKIWVSLVHLVLVITFIYILTDGNLHGFLVVFNLRRFAVRTP